MTDQKQVLPILKPTRKKANDPAAYDESILYAVRAFAKGEANEGQQKEVFSWLVNNLSRFGEISFSESDRESNFIEGRRFVGWQLMAMLEAGATPIVRKKDAGKDND